MARCIMNLETGSENLAIRQSMKQIGLLNCGGLLKSDNGAGLSAIREERDHEMTLYEALEMVERGETPEEYKKRISKIRRYANERNDLEDAIEVLGDDPRAEKKRARLAKVNRMLQELA